jgi:hypothetical protein
VISWRLSLQDVMLALAWAVLSIGAGDTIRGMEGGKPITVCLACNRCAAA